MLLKLVETMRGANGKEVNFTYGSFTTREQAITEAQKMIGQGGDAWKTRFSIIKVED